MRDFAAPCSSVTQGPSFIHPKQRLVDGKGGPGALGRSTVTRH
jgi:hypothetical protein